MQQILSDWIIPDLANIISEYVEETRILVVGDRSVMPEFKSQEVYSGKFCFITENCSDIDSLVIVVDKDNIDAILEYIYRYKTIKDISVIVSGNGIKRPRIKKGKGLDIHFESEWYTTSIFCSEISRVIYVGDTLSLSPENLVDMITK
jgi:hypothetical protein